jgi:hypothetical protein
MVDPDTLVETHSKALSLRSWCSRSQNCCLRHTPIAMALGILCGFDVNTDNIVTCHKAVRLGIHTTCNTLPTSLTHQSWSLPSLAILGLYTLFRIMRANISVTPC